MLNSTVRTYIVLALIFAVVGGILFFMVSLPPSEDPPRGPIEIGVGPVPEADRNETEVYVDIPSRTLDVRVTFRFNETRKYFIYVLLPYQVLETSAYAIYGGGLYPHELRPNEAGIGNFSTNHWFNSTTGSSILNASLDVDPSFPWSFAYPDMKAELTLGVTITLENSLVAISYPLGASESVVMTFFGSYSGIMSDEMYAFEQPLSQPTLGQPFIVHVRLPSSTYFSYSQPSPIQYYIKQDYRWLMFSLDFIEGRYAQTLYCTITDPTRQSLKEIMVFVGTALLALASSFGVEGFVNRGKEQVDSEKKNNTEEKSQKRRANKTLDLLKIQIYADRSHTKLTSLLSFIFAYSIGLTVLFYTVLYQGLGPNPGMTWLAGFIGTWISTLAFLGYILRDNNKDMKAISRMIEAIKDGKPLPEFEKLSRKTAE
jgi:FtsH-binding integral membrane protein